MDANGRTALIVNGDTVSVDGDGVVPLIHVLRGELGLMGVRAGCAIGECGACTVLLDDVPARSCITPLSEAAGRDVVTPEGLGTPDAPHPIQQAFIDEQAAQCGYCVNGMVMTLAGFARQGQPPADTDVAALLQEHLCRCGTYARLIRAARRALGLPPLPDQGDSLHEASAPPEPASLPAANELPAVIQADPRIGRWIEIEADGTIAVEVGKVELGQGIRTAFSQIVAAQLGVPTERIAVRPTRTGRSPDQWFTAGSLSIEDGGTALAYAAAACRRVLLARGAAALGVDVGACVLTDGGVTTADGAAVVRLTDLGGDGFDGEQILPSDLIDWDAGPIGRPVPRIDLAPKLTGAPAFLQDLVLPDMLHARIAFPPDPAATLVGLDPSPTTALPGVVDVVRDGNLVIVLAEREEQAVRAADRLRRDLRWRAGPSRPPHDLRSLYRHDGAERFTAADDGVEVALAEHRSHRASYASPYQAHGPMGPSVAVAQRTDDELRVWTHAQGVYPLRRELAALLDRPVDSVVVEHVDGPGCYGMNGADDAAAFAAIAAAAAGGRPVRFQFSIQDEFGWEPYGPAMLTDLEAGIDGSGRVRAWRHHTLTDTHMMRPNGSGDRLAAAWLREGSVPRPWAGAGEGGGRNSVPVYDVGAVQAYADHVRGPLRTAALRCLGAYHNLFAVESFMDELAELAGHDPVAFRLTHLRDPRARAVLELVADRAGWQPRVGPSGRGVGVAVAQYKGSKAYVAVVAEVEVDREAGRFRVHRMVLACDAGVVVNPDGLRNQLEGGALQGLSRALFEQLHPGPHGVRERDWTTYGALRFGDVPSLDVHLLARPDRPPLGAGESATPVVPAAVANALDDAIGIRLRELPLTAAQMERRLLEMGSDEAARVLL